MDSSNKEEDENTSESLIKRIDEFLTLRKYKHAWRLSKALVLNEPNNIDYLMLQVRILFKQKRYNMAAGYISDLESLGGVHEDIEKLRIELTELRKLEEKILLASVPLESSPRAMSPRPSAPPALRNTNFDTLTLVHEFYEETERDYPLYKMVVGLFLERISSINALVYLQIKTKYNSRKMGFASAMLIPLLTMAMMYVIFAYIRKRQPGDMSIEVFILTGMTAWLIFTGSMGVFIDLMRKSPNPLKMHTVVNSFDVCIANVLMAIVPVLAISTLIVIGLFMTDIQITIGDFPLLLLCLLGSILFGCGTGIIFGVLSLYTEVFLNIRNIFTRALFLMSGIFFSIDELPSNIYALVKFVPLVHIIEGLRFSLSTTYPAKSMSLPFAFSTIFGILVISVILNSVRRRYKEL